MVGLFSGAVRMYHAAKRVFTFYDCPKICKCDKRFRCASHIIRGLVEALGLGAALLSIDLFVHCVRKPTRGLKLRIDVSALLSEITSSPEERTRATAEVERSMRVLNEINGGREMDLGTLVEQAEEGGHMEAQRLFQEAARQLTQAEFCI